jgi:hypothetical protein
MHVWLHVLLYSAIGCLAMIAKDITSTVYTDAVANGRHKLAGNMDGLNDYVQIILASFSGVELIHLGWRGWIGIIPIGLIGKYTTQHAVKWSNKNIKQADEHHENN